MKTQDIAVLGALGIAAYFIWRSTTAIKKGVDSAVTAVAKGYVALTTGETVPLGSIQLPNGQWVPVSSVNVKPGPGTSATFTYNGASYTINGPSDGNGNWVASSGGTVAASDPNADFGVSPGGWS